MTHGDEDDMQHGDPDLMRAAIALAVDGVRHDRGGPFGAVVTRDGVVVARGENRVTSSNDPTAHAEVVAIREACAALGTFSLSGCELYTSCEPCPMCMGAIAWSRVDRVFYAATREDAAAAGFDDAVFYEQVCLPPERRALPPTTNVLRDEAAEPFRLWGEKDDRVEY